MLEVMFGGISRARTLSSWVWRYLASGFVVFRDHEDEASLILCQQIRSVSVLHSLPDNFDFLCRRLPFGCNRQGVVKRAIYIFTQMAGCGITHREAEFLCIFNRSRLALAHQIVKLHFNRMPCRDDSLGAFPAQWGFGFGTSHAL